jgi:formate hydrogenlyase subunit 3/multisubunit Na+/H+ antiporter MnhD subunit
METNNKYKIDPIGWFLLITLFLCLALAGFYSYKSIDWSVLKRLENSPLILPTPKLVATPTITKQ